MKYSVGCLLVALSVVRVAAGQDETPKLPPGFRQMTEREIAWTQFYGDDDSPMTGTSEEWEAVLKRRPWNNGKKGLNFVGIGIQDEPEILGGKKLSVFTRMMHRGELHDYVFNGPCETEVTKYEVLFRFKVNTVHVRKTEDQGPFLPVTEFKPFTAQLVTRPLGKSPNTVRKIAVAYYYVDTRPGDPILRFGNWKARDANFEVVYPVALGTPRKY